MTREGDLRPRMAWIHGWLGLIAGWILFVMFLSGTAAYFRPEITRWMQPEHRAVAVSEARAIDAALHTLRERASDADEWSVYLPSEREPTIHGFTSGGSGRFATFVLDAATGAPIVARQTEGGEFFVRLHYTLYLPQMWGQWLCGLCAMAMLAAIISGVITHKRILADFFTLRWGKGQRSWLDAHNLPAVLGLPYHAIITYSGLIALATAYMPLPIRATYPNAVAGYFAEAYADAPPRKAAGKAAARAPLAPMVADAERRWGGVAVSSVTIQHPGDAASVVTIVARPGAGLGARGPALSYDGASGRLLGASPPDGPALATLKTLFGLHLAYFAGPPSRWLLFLLGLAGTTMVGSGLCLWTVKRARLGGTFGHGLVQRLNVAVIACFPAGIAAYFFANRLIPAGVAGRATGELAACFGLWAGLAAAAALRPVRRAWIETLAIGAMLYGGVVFADLALVGWPAEPLFAAFDCAMLACAALLAFAARRVARPATPRLRLHHRETAHGA